MDNKQKLLNEFPVSEYGSNGSGETPARSSIAYQRFKNNNPGIGAADTTNQR